MKKALFVFVLAVFVVTIAGIAQAAETGQIKITVSVAPTLSVELSADTLDLGAVAAGSKTESAAVTLTNDGSGTKEKFSLVHTKPSDWAPAATAGAEAYVLKASFAGGDYVSVDGAVSGAVISGSTVDLKFQFEAPTSTTVTTEQEVTVTVTAELAQ